MDVTIRTDEFDKKFKKLIEESVPALVERGMGRAMLSLMGDVIMERPTPPVLEGFLRGSISIFVQNEFVTDSSGMPMAKVGKATTQHKESIPRSTWVGVIGMNVPYAAKMHEGVGIQFSEKSIASGAGPKFLEVKMLKNGRKYLGEVADAIKEGGGK